MSVTLPNGAGIVSFKYDPFGNRQIGDSLICPIFLLPCRMRGYKSRAQGQRPEIDERLLPGFRRICVLPRICCTEIEGLVALTFSGAQAP
jgi:hypothetical protein